VSWVDKLRAWWQAGDNSEEARAQMLKLELRDAEVNQLGAELRELQRRNNFSGMVHDAIIRTSPKGPKGEPAG
jgi:hypothetical protein